MKIYVGNLQFDFTEEELHQLFADYGRVESTSIPRDRLTDRTRGFAFVEMPAKVEAQAAIAALNGKEVRQRTLAVSEARPKEERSPNSRVGGGSHRPYPRNNNQRSDKKGPAKRAKRQRR